MRPSTTAGSTTAEAALALLGDDELRQAAATGDDDAACTLARRQAGRGEVGRARRTLRDAAGRGHPGALTELALFQLWGIGAAPDLAEGRRLLLAAEQAGSAEAMWTLAWLAFADALEPFDATRIAERVRRAAALDFAPALRACALLYARHPGRGAVDLTRACLMRAIALGDRPAAVLLGVHLRLADPRSADAIALLRQAVVRGSARAAEWLGDDAAADLPARPLPPPAPLPDLPELHLDALPAPAWQVLSGDPRVEIADEVLSPLECEYVIALGEHRLQRSEVSHDAASGSQRLQLRTSSDMAFRGFDEDLVLRWLQWRMCTAIGVRLDHAEPLVLLRYLHGDEYRPHRDYLAPGVEGNSPALHLPGQRLHTVFCYLTDVGAGGCTDFPQLDLRIDPRRGRLVHFVNLQPDGSPDPRTLHAGMPVEAGQKWLATLWTRQRRARLL